ncbi:MAG: glycosyltransferase family 4 protein [Akkermansia sp.]|nr:glycosyltransferase family 4 protein [Akkermansia sp.]
MKILHYSPHMRPGSTSVLAADLACALQSAECENIVVAPSSEIVNRLYASKVAYVSCHRPNLLTAWREVRRLRKLIRRQAPDIVQVYSTDAAWIVNMACRRPRRMTVPPVVGAICGYVWHSTSELGWSKCDYHTVLSRHQRELLTAETSPLKCMPEIIPYGTDERLCNPNYQPTESWFSTWRAQQPGYDNHLSICVPGSISPLRGLEDIAPILTGLLRSGIQAHVYIAGNYRKARTVYVNELKLLYSNAGLTEHISWLGERADMRDVLCACDVTLSLCKKPATWDRAIQEALALGRPVIGYDYGAVGEYLNSFLPEGRVTPGDIAAVMDTLTQWSSYPPSSLASIPAPYRLSDTAAAYMKLYSEILKTKS